MSDCSNLVRRDQRARKRRPELRVPAHFQIPSPRFHPHTFLWPCSRTDRARRKL